MISVKNHQELPAIRPGRVLRVAARNQTDIIIIIIGLSSVSWSGDHIGDALIDTGIGPSPPKQEAKRAKVKREEWCSLAGPVIR